MSEGWIYMIIVGAVGLLEVAGFLFWVGLGLLRFDAAWAVVAVTIERKARRPEWGGKDGK